MFILTHDMANDQKIVDLLMQGILQYETFVDTSTLFLAFCIVRTPAAVIYRNDDDVVVAYNGRVYTPLIGAACCDKAHCVHTIAAMAMCYAYERIVHGAYQPV